MAVPEIQVVEVGLVDDGPDFAAFFRTEYPGLVALATAVTGSRQAGEDIAAEAMSRAFQRWDRVSGYDRPGAWTRRVAINLLHSRRRRVASEIRAVLRIRPRPDQAAADVTDEVVGAGTVKSHLHAARAAIARFLEENES